MTEDIIEYPLRQMKCFEDRLLTFHDWPLKDVDPLKLANNGFYYLKKFDIVRCFHCNIELGSFRSTDVISEEHLKYSKDCGFAKLCVSNKKFYRIEYIVIILLITKIVCIMLTYNKYC